MTLYSYLYHDDICFIVCHCYSNVVKMCVAMVSANAELLLHE